MKSGFAQRSVLGVGVLCALPKIFKVLEYSLGRFLGEAKPKGRHNLPPPLVEIKVNVTENLGKATALPALPLITPLTGKDSFFQKVPILMHLSYLQT